LIRRTGLFLLLAAAGFFLYLWPALRSPVVLWSDSTIDLDWARRGVGIVSPVPPPAAGELPQHHPAKPAYLLFLRLVLAVAPEGQEPRTVVVAQSLLLWLSIVGTSLFLVHRRWVGLIFLAVLLSFFRVRESASAVMPEALAAALLLPIAAIILDSPRARGWLASLGAGIGLLFWVRPNAGGVALVLALVAAAVHRRGRDAATLAAGFALLFLPIWFLTRPGSGLPSLRGLSHPVFEASTDYYWLPHDQRTAALRPDESGERQELARARTNWDRLLRGRGPDTRRQLVWRALHGLLGTEFSAAPFWSRVAAPFEILAAISFVLVALLRGPERVAAVLGSLLLLLLVAQNLVLGSNPRFVLPFLPALFLFGSIAATRKPAALAGAVFVALLVVFAIHPYPLGWEWGRIERAGVRIHQQVRRGALPRRAPATLHLRMAAPLLPSAAHFELRGPAGRLLYSSAGDPRRERPAVTVSLPQDLLDLNSREPIDLELASFGSYGETQYLLFPVVPPPWRQSAWREPSPDLSPSTGIRRGSLDWWAHPGAP
jgi:hypothetical protein